MTVMKWERNLPFEFENGMKLICEKEEKIRYTNRESRNRTNANKILSSVQSLVFVSGQQLKMIL